MKKAEKVFFVDNLAATLKDARGVVIVDFAHLSVSRQQDLKKRLKTVGATLSVVKNTLLKRAGDAARVDSNLLTDTVLTGQTALVLSDSDPFAAISVVSKFAKEADTETPSFKAGFLAGDFYDQATLVKIAALPSREALLGQLFGVLAGPEYGLVSTLNGNLQKLVHTLNLKIQMSNVKATY